MKRWVLAWVLAAGWLLAVDSALAAPPDTTTEGPRMVRGEVTRVSEARGTMTLKTAEGDVELHLPPATLKGIRKGDRLTVRLAVRHAAGPAAGRAETPARGAATIKSP